MSWCGNCPEGTAIPHGAPLAATPHSFFACKRGVTFKDHILQRVLAEADHIIRTGDTVRGTAKVFGVSKTTVHIDMTMRLPRIHSQKAKEVNKVLEFNFNEKHIRGGTARREKCKRS